MNKTFILLMLITVPIIGLSAQNVSEPSAAKTRCQATIETNANAETFQKWVDDVWHAGKLGLVKDLVGQEYVRHEAKGTRSVTPAQYTDEIVATRNWLPNIRFIIHECTATGDRVWTRWTMVGTDPKTGMEVRRMGTQIYRLAGARLVETWILVLPTDSAWPEVLDLKKNGPVGKKP
jgi:predicted ester cyclase